MAVAQTGIDDEVNPLREDSPIDVEVGRLSGDRVQVGEVEDVQSQGIADGVAQLNGSEDGCKMLLTG